MTVQIDRRALLAFIGASPVLVACAPGSAPRITTIAAGIRAVGQEAVLFAPQLKQAGMDDATLGKVQGGLVGIENVAQAVSDAATATDGQPTLIKIEGYINAIAPVVLPFVSLIPGGAAIALIVAALPALEFAVNLGVSLLTPQARTLAKDAPVVPTSGRVGGVLSNVIPSQDYLNYLIDKHGLSAAIVR